VREEKCNFIGGLRINATHWTGDTHGGLTEPTPNHRFLSRTNSNSGLHIASVFLI
jgi:hypothetical protein